MKLLLVLALICVAVAQNQVGVCRLVPTNAAFNGIGGVIYFSTNGNQVTVNASVTGLTGLASASSIGIHVHTYGDIRPSDSPGYNVGPHYNPNVITHGCPPGARENGDMGNWDVVDGAITQIKDLDLLAMTGGQSIIGRAVVVHQTTDDCASATSAGTRMAYCVIGIANTPTANTAYNNNGTVTFGTCSLQPVSGGAYGGLVTFAASATGITVKANVTGLTGIHGLHIHAFGDLNGGAQVGGHYDPLATNTHALPTYLPDAAHHVGDIGNICDNAAGVYYYQASFAAPKFADQYGIVGRSLVIHAGPDDNGTVTYGARVAYCVIGVAKEDNLAATFATPPVTFTSPLCGYVAPTQAPGAPTPAPVTTSDATDFATISVFIAITTLLAMLF